jgi:hypothetical protein
MPSAADQALAQEEALPAPGDDEEDDAFDLDEEE